jgi:hypothetical protein
VKPGAEAIKPKDYYERGGTLHQFRRMPKFILADQYRIWTSPFHTSKSDAKWWAIWGGTVGGLIAADRYIERSAPTNDTLVRVGSRATVACAFSIRLEAIRTGRRDGRASAL